jgi:hypothetical protein
MFSSSLFKNTGQTARDDFGGKPNLGMRRASMLFVLQNGSFVAPAPRFPRRLD